MVLFHWKNLFYSLVVAPTKAGFQVFSLSRQKYHSKTVKGTIGIVSEFKNDAWRQVGTLQRPRYGHTAIIFNNLIYVIGGKGNVFDQEWYFRSTSGQASGQAGTILSMCWKRIKAFDHLKPKSGNQMTIGLNSKLLLSDQNWKITKHIPNYLFWARIFLVHNDISLLNNLIFHPSFIIELLFTYLHIRNTFDHKHFNEFSYSLHGIHIAFIVFK